MLVSNVSNPGSEKLINCEAMAVLFSNSNSTDTQASDT